MPTLPGLTRGVVRLLQSAKTHAARGGQHQAAPEHLLLALIEARHITGSESRQRKLRAALEQKSKKNLEMGSIAARENAARLKRVLARASLMAAASAKRQADIPEVLQAIVQEEKDLAIMLGDSPDFDRKVSETVTPSTPLPAKVWFLASDFDKGQPIYPQIVAQIEEAIATGRLTEAERLPSVRDLAAELDVAPGTVARAYTDLESRGLLETDRAYGTHVAARQRDKSRAEARMAQLVELLRPTAITAYNLGSNAKELHEALSTSMEGILDSDE